jgi:hypothetical protein
MIRKNQLVNDLLVKDMVGSDYQMSTMSLVLTYALLHYITEIKKYD